MEKIVTLSIVWTVILMVAGVLMLKISREASGPAPPNKGTNTPG